MVDLSSCLRGVTGLDGTLLTGRFNVGTASGSSLLRVETVSNKIHREREVLV